MNRYRSLIVATPSGTGDRPISVADAKEHLRIIDNTTDDDYIGDLIDAATQWCEDFCERTFADKQYTVAFDDFMSVRIELPRPPVRLHVTGASATVSISYVDTGGVTQTLVFAQSGTQDFRLDRDILPPIVYPLYLQTWPSVRLDDKALQITYLAGYGGAANVPRPLMHAMKLLVSHWYSMREPITQGQWVQQVPLTVHALLEPLKWAQYS